MRVDTMIRSAWCTFLDGLISKARAQPRSAKPGNVLTNWTGMSSHQADYCRSSSGKGDSAGNRLCPTHVIEEQGGFGGEGQLRGPCWRRAVLGSASEQGRPSHRCQRFARAPPLPFGVCVGLLTRKPRLLIAWAIKTAHEGGGCLCVLCVGGMVTVQVQRKASSTGSPLEW